MTNASNPLMAPGSDADAARLGTVRLAWLLPLVFLGYLGTAHLGDHLFTKPYNFTLFWLPAGLYVASLLLTPTRRWPAVMAAAAAANLAFDLRLIHGFAAAKPLWASLGFACANTCDAVIIATLMRRFVAHRPSLSTQREVLGLVLATALGALPGAALGALIVHRAFGGAYTRIWLDWWSGAALGILTLAPVILTCAVPSRPSFRAMSLRSIIHGVVLLAASVFVTAVAFADAGGMLFHRYLIIPLILWAAIRFGSRGAALCGLVIACAAGWASTPPTAQPPGGRRSAASQALASQSRLGIVSFCGLFVAAVLAERERASQETRRGRALLQAITEGTSDAIYVKDRQGRYLVINDSALAMTHRSREEVLGRNDHALFPLEDALALVERDRAIMASGVATTHEEVLSFAGEPHTLLTVKGPVRDPAGQVIGLFGIARDITQRKNADQALRLTQARYRSLFEHMAEGVALHRLVRNQAGEAIDYEILDVNPAYEAILKLDRAQVVGRRASVVYSTTPPPYLDQYAQVASTAQPCRFETHYAPTDQHFAISCVSPELDFFATIFEDISARKRADESRDCTIALLGICNRLDSLPNLLSELTAYFQQLSGCEAVGIRLRDGDDFPYYESRGFPPEFIRAEKYLCARDAAGELVRDSAGDPVLECMCGNILCGRFDPAKPFFTPHGSFWSNCTTELLASTTDADRQARTRNRCNGEGYESVALIPIRSSGQTLGLLQLNSRQTGRFTPERIALYEALANYIAIAIVSAQAKAAVKSSEAELNAIFEHAPVPMFLMDANRGVRKANRAAAALANDDSRQLAGQLCGDVIRCINSLNNAGGCGQGSGCQTCSIRLALLKALPAGAPQFQVEAPLQLIREAQTREVHTLISTTPLMAGHEPLALVCIENITRRKQLEAQLLQSRKMEAIGQLAGGVAHDFRNQLTVIKGYADMLRRRSLVQGEGAPMLEEMLNAARRGADLTAQLLSFSRKDMLQPEVVDLAQLVARLSTSLGRLVAEDITVSVTAGDDCVVSVSTPQLQSALMNLAANARDAMPRGGLLTIATECIDLDAQAASLQPDARPGRYVRLSVTDTGCGMDAQTAAHIFEPFFTTKQAGQGTGLGLAMVYGFVTQSGGFATVQSAPGRGTTIAMHFPHAGRPAQPAAGDAAQAPPCGAGERVLVVEDEVPIRRLIVQSLEEAGYRVIETADSIEAMRLAADAGAPFDLLITDVVMPDASGPDLARCMRQHRPGVPVLFISGYSGGDLAQRGVDMDRVELLVKPFKHRNLLGAVRRMLDQR